MQQTINERLKFLIEALGISARAFSRTLDVSESTTRNYLDKSTKPSTDYIERIANHFKSVNLAWLITGEGEPLLSSTDENEQTSISVQKNFKSPFVGKNEGTANQQQYNLPNLDTDETRTKLALAEKEIEHLRAQLAMKDTVIASKEETITLLRVAFNRPN